MGPSRDSLTLALRCARLLHEKKLEEIKVFKVADSIQITDYFVLASGLNNRHLRSAGDHLIEECREAGVLRTGLEGYRDGGWILIDFSEVVVHLFLPELRRHYDLELLWGDSPRVDWQRIDWQTMSAEGASAQGAGAPLAGSPAGGAEASRSTAAESGAAGSRSSGAEPEDSRGAASAPGDSAQGGRAPLAPHAAARDAAAESPARPDPRAAARGGDGA